MCRANSSFREIDSWLCSQRRMRTKPTAASDSNARTAATPVRITDVAAMTSTYTAVIAQAIASVQYWKIASAASQVSFWIELTMAPGPRRRSVCSSLRSQFAKTLSRKV